MLQFPGRRAQARRYRSAGKDVRAFSDYVDYSVVMAGLDPAIHHLRKKMDARVKPVHDGRESGAT
jgi:hypothetical protein